MHRRRYLPWALGLVIVSQPFSRSFLSGKWGCYKTEGDIDGYWKATGLPWLARKGLQLMDWGAGKNQNIREFLQEGDKIKMDYSFDGPGLGGLGFTEAYTVGSGVQEITRMGGAKILVDPAWESDSVLRVQNMNPAKQTKGWAKTLLSGWASLSFPFSCIHICISFYIICIWSYSHICICAFLSGGEDADAEKQMVDGEGDASVGNVARRSWGAGDAEVIDVHRFYLEAGDVWTRFEFRSPWPGRLSGS